MSEWTCPNCLGGFPTSALRSDSACPWCEFMLGEVASRMKQADPSQYEGHPWTPAHKDGGYVESDE